MKKKEELFDADAQLDALFGAEGIPERAAAKAGVRFFHGTDHRKGPEESFCDARSSLQK